MATTTDHKTIVVVDDELHNMLWLIDYLEAKGFRVLTAESVNDALELIGKEIYRALVIDLNLPVLPPLEEEVAAAGIEYKTFPGLYIADKARNFGYRDRQVMLYSVHRDPGVAQIAQRMGMTYIMKGRPHEIKAEIDMVVSYDPTAH
ncbi:response regulator [Mesorhizobium sp. M0622]|uniref:response regulator n=1 Tax=unclassified Mesorhizobium TaxID=325217 RepID=UPI00333B8430